MSTYFVLSVFSVCETSKRDFNIDNNGLEDLNLYFDFSYSYKSIPAD